MKTSAKSHKQKTYQQFMDAHTVAENQFSLFVNLPAVAVPPPKVDPYLGTPEDWKILENASHTHHLRPCYLARLVLTSVTSLRTADRDLIVYIHEPNRESALAWLKQFHPNDQLHFLAPLSCIGAAPAGHGDRRVVGQKVATLSHG